MRQYAKLAHRYFEVTGIDDGFKPQPNGKVIEGRVPRDEWDIFISNTGSVSRVWRAEIDLEDDHFSSSPAQFLTTFGLRSLVLDACAITTGYCDEYPDLNNVTLDNIAAVIPGLQLVWQGVYPDNQRGIWDFAFYFSESVIVMAQGEFCDVACLGMSSVGIANALRGLPSYNRS